MHKKVAFLFNVPKVRSFYPAAFTIVELLVVIVVIGILATITIVSYTGIQQKAVVTSLASDLVNASQQLKMFQIDNNAFPTSIIDCPTPATGNACIKSSLDTTYQYTASNSLNPQAFCITATKGTTSYKITNDSTPTTGGCPGHGVGGIPAITNLETNPSSETAALDHAGAGSSSISISSTQKLFGSYSTRCAWVSIFSGVQTHIISVNQNTSYAVSLYVYSESGPIPGFSIAASDYSTNLRSLSAIPGSGQWYRSTINYTTATGQTTILIWTTQTVASVFYVDGVMINQGNTISNYADGSSPNWVWNGTVNASTSTGPTL